MMLQNADEIDKKLKSQEESLRKISQGSSIGEDAIAIVVIIATIVISVIVIIVIIAILSWSFPFSNQQPRVDG